MGCEGQVTQCQVSWSLGSLHSFIFIGKTILSWPSFPFSARCLSCPQGFQGPHTENRGAQDLSSCILISVGKLFSAPSKLYHITLHFSLLGRSGSLPFSFSLLCLAFPAEGKKHLLLPCLQLQQHYASCFSLGQTYNMP